MKPRKVQLRGEVRWLVESYHGAKRRRWFFRTKAAAEGKQRQLEADREGFGAGWLQLSAADRATALRVVEEARGKGVSLRAVWDAYLSGQLRAVKRRATVEEALAAMLIEKRGENLRANYLTNLKQAVQQFAAGRLAQPVDEFSAEDVKAFIAAGGSPNTRATRRGRMMAFFSFCLRQEFTAANVCARIKKPKVDRRPPRILSIAEVRDVMECVAAEHPHALGWFALALFAGIRVEECDQTAWAAVDFEHGQVNLAAGTHKTRNEHVVELPPNAFAWLIHAREAGARLPLPKTARRDVQRALRVKLGLKAWPADVLRHSFCSYGAVAFGRERTAELADHSEAVLRKHYKNRVSRADAKEFFSIEPGALSGGSGEGAVNPARSKLRAQAVEQQPRSSCSEHLEPKTP